MKSGQKDKAEGKMHRVKGRIKEVIGKIFMAPKLESKGKKEKFFGKIQENIGKVKKIVNK